MSFKDLKKEFEHDIENNPAWSVRTGAGMADLTAQEAGEAIFRRWLLRLLFEINGNLDSLSADYKAMRQAMEKRNGGK